MGFIPSKDTPAHNHQQSWYGYRFWSFLDLLHANIFQCAPIVASTEKYWLEDGLQKTEACSHTTVVMIVCWYCDAME